MDFDEIKKLTYDLAIKFAKNLNRYDFGSELE